MSGIFAELKAEIRASARGRSRVTMAVSELLQLADVLQEREDSWSADVAKRDVTIATLEGRVRQLESNLAAAERRRSLRSPS